MSIKNFGSVQGQDRRFEEIMSFYDPSMEEEFLHQWKNYSEEEKDRIHREIMTDRK